VSNRILGIDLGTVNSCVAVVEDGRARLLSDDSQTVIPSCLHLQHDKEIVGHAAKRQAVTDPLSTVSAVKRLLGHSFESPEVQAVLRRVPYPIRPSPVGSVVLEIGGRELTPVQISARILQRIREVAGRALDEDIRRAVISVPAHFTDIQRKATKLAAEYAGLEVVRLINEPTAAAFAYGYRQQKDFCLAVYDLGGGTFDITVMTAQGDRFQVDATDGDSFLGGEDFDEAIVEWLIDAFFSENGHDLRGDQAAELRLREAAEKAKIELSQVEETRIELPFLAQLADGSRPLFATTLTRETLVELTRELVQKTLDLCGRCLEAANIQRIDIDEVLLVGGQSRTAGVRDAVREFFGKEPRRDINPDEVVAMGAALYGHSLAAANLKEEEESAAEESYAVALKDADVVRKVLDEVRQVGSGSTGEQDLADRLKALLALTEGPGESKAGGNARDGDVRETVSREDLPELVVGADLPDYATGSNLPDHASGPNLPEHTMGANLPEPGAGQNLPDHAVTANLPDAVENLREELMDLNDRAEEFIQQLAEEFPEANEFDEESQEVFGRASQCVSKCLESAHEASERAQEHLKKASEHAKVRKVILIDVTSHALGIASAGELFTRLIDKNCPIPAKRTRMFTTNQDGQAEVAIRVYQGGSQHVSDNQLLGEFVLEGIAPAPRMEPRIDVEFAIDADGILAVTARDGRSGREQGIRVEDPLSLHQADPEAEVPELGPTPAES
jgi:molecular chaperone DnaK